MKKLASTTLLSLGLLSANVFASDNPVMVSFVQQVIDYLFS